MRLINFTSSCTEPQSVTPLQFSCAQFERDIAIPFAVDVRETDKEITIVADTPGLRKEDIKVWIHPNV